VFLIRLGVKGGREQESSCSSKCLDFGIKLVEIRSTCFFFVYIFYGRENKQTYILTLRKKYSG
jgi:hypothetical protein